MSGRRQPGADRLCPPPGGQRQQELGADLHLRHHPGLLRVREWEDLKEGDAFTDEDVHDVSMVCLLGQTLVHELFEDESPLGKEVLVNDVPLKVIGVLSTKGTNIIGIDQDDILLAPWTTIKFRVSASSSPTRSTPRRGASDDRPEFSLLARRYPRSQTGLYPASRPPRWPTRPGSNGSRTSIRSSSSAESTEEIPAAMVQITELFRERHQVGPDKEDDFDVRDFTEVIQRRAIDGRRWWPGCCCAWR